MMTDEELFTCSGCGTILELDVVHDCDVLGTEVLLTDSDAQHGLAVRERG